MENAFEYIWATFRPNDASPVLLLTTFFNQSLINLLSVPDGIPQNLTAHNWTSLYTLPVSWQPVPANQMNGKLTGYYLTYYAVKLGDKDLLNYDVTEVTLLPNATSYTIKGLQPLSVYRVGVVASTAKGVGPKAITVGGKNVELE